MLPGKNQHKKTNEAPGMLIRLHYHYHQVLTGQNARVRAHTHCYSNKAARCDRDYREGPSPVGGGRHHQPKEANISRTMKVIFHIHRNYLGRSLWSWSTCVTQTIYYFLLILFRLSMLMGKPDAQCFIFDFLKIYRL